MKQITTYFVWLNIDLFTRKSIITDRPVTRILCGGVLTKSKWTKLSKCIFLSSDPFIRESGDT